MLSHNNLARTVYREASAADAKPCTEAG